MVRRVSQSYIKIAGNLVEINSARSDASIHPGGLSAQIAGALPIGEASYAIPQSNAIYVAPNGNNSNNGSLGSPKQTVASAISAVAAGGTIVLRGGEYREEIGEILKTCIIQNYPNETVWFDGTDIITSWTASGGLWYATLPAQFDHSASHTTGSDAGGFVGAQNPMAAWPDMVFIDGVRQWQVEESDTPTTGQFKVNYSENRVYIATQPSGHEVRVTARDIHSIWKNKITFRGIGVRRYATPLPRVGMLNLVGSSSLPGASPNGAKDSIIENCHFVDSGSQAVGISGDSITVRSNTFLRSGFNAIGSSSGSNIIVENNYINYTNVEKWNVAPSSGAMKLVRNTDLTIRHNIIDNSDANYIWLDITCLRFTIYGNKLTRQPGSMGNYGIFAELSEEGIIANNWVDWSGGTYGITAFDSGNVRIYNNTISGATSWGIGTKQDARRSATSENPPLNSLNGQVPWIVVDTEICNNFIAANNTLYKMRSHDDADTIPADSMMKLVAGNLIGATSTQPFEAIGMFGWGNGGSVPTSYRTPAALEAAKPTKARNNTLIASGAPNSTDAQTHYLKAEPLASDIATLLGVANGSRWIGPIFNQPTIQT